MIKLINTIDTYIKNIEPNNNYSLDTITTLESEVINSNGIDVIKSNTRILFKLDDYNIDYNFQNLLNDPNAKFIYRLAIADININKFTTAISTVDIEIHKLTKPWKRGLGDYDTVNETGVTWNNYDTNKPWDNEGGDIDYSNDYLTLNIDIIGDNMEENYYIDLDITSLVRNSTYIELINNGFIIKFSEDLETVDSSVASFNFHSAINTDESLPVSSGFYTVIKENDIFNENINIDNNSYLTTDKLNSIVTYVDNIGTYDLQYPIFFNVKLVDINNTKKQIYPSAMSSYKIIDYFSNITIINPDFEYNTIKCINNKLFYELDSSIFKKNRTYKFVPVWVTTDTNQKIVHNEVIIFTTI